MKNFNQRQMLVALLCIAFSVPSIATIEESAVTVSFDDLNLSQQAGVETLYGRIKSAARQVCGPYDSRNLGIRQLTKQCYTETISGAVQSINNEKLSALHMN